MNEEKFTSSKTGAPASAKAPENRKNTRSPSGARSVPRGKEVYFELDASAAKEVLLAGDFTGWEKTPIKLNRSERGTWKTSVTLAPGQYHYKFVVDGQWRDDPRARSTCPNPFGGCDSVVEIS